jgi:hypothetical protein
MKVNLVLILAIALLAASCDKEKYQTRPQLKFKEVNNTELLPGQVLSMLIEFTDAEGDIQDTMWIQKVTSNCATSNFTDVQKIPEFEPTKNLKGEFNVAYSYIQVNPKCAGKNDTCFFRFWARDKAKNVSDTVVSPVIVIKR